MKKRILGLAVFGLILSGCGQKVKTFEYYKAHIDEAKEVAKKCETLDKSDQAISQDCKNANSALVMTALGSGATTAPAYGTYKVDPSFKP